jgi:myo-inositol 2-dehydrogenase/D-chiro-inositol 1-dehydrogenase
MGIAGGNNMIRIGFIGAGWVAEQHLAALKQIEDVKVTSIYNPTRAKAEALAAGCGAEVCESPSQVIQNVDVVYALAPQDMRIAHVMEAARHKRHLFIEKPLANTLSEADRQIEVVEAAGIKVQMGFVMRKFANFKLLHDTFASGELGELVTVWTRRMWYRTFPADYYQASLARCGGLTNELNVHDFDWLRTIGGEARTVYGRVVGTRTDRDVEENSWSLLTFEHGFGSVGTSWLSALSDTSAGIVGTKGTILLQNNTVTKKLIDGEAEEKTEFSGDLMAEAYLAQEREFIDCIKADRQPPASIYDGRAATAIALAVLASSRTDSVVTIK